MFDVVGLGFDGGYLIQAKRTKKYTPSKYKIEVKQIQEWIRNLPHTLPDWIHVQLWVWVERKGFIIFDITKNKVSQKNSSYFKP